MAKIFFLLVTMAVFLSTALAMDLTGNWRSSTGDNIYVRQIDNAFWYYGESSAETGNWTSVGYGTVEGNTVKMNWADVPKGNASQMGTALLNITSDKEMQVINQTGGWGSNGMKLMKVGSGF
jgi:hypothetical protein